jgi:hypothetical protein
MFGSRWRHIDQLRLGGGMAQFISAPWQERATTIWWSNTVEKFFEIVRQEGYFGFSSRLSTKMGLITSYQTAAMGSYG